MGHYGDLYAQVRKRTSALVADADPETVVPCTPEWTIKDVIAHVTGICADLAAGKLEGTGTAAWTAAQVDSRSDKSVAEIIDEWATVGPGIEDVIDSFGELAGKSLLQDVVIHEHDIRCALDQPGARDTKDFAEALNFNLERLARRITKEGLPTLKVVVDSQERVLGEGEPTATLTTDSWTMLRLLAGRRSRDQIRGLEWDGDPSPWMDRISMYGFADTAIES